MRFRHRARISTIPGTTTGTPGHFDENDQWVPATEITAGGGVVYDGPADYNGEPRVMQRDQAGVPTLTADATLMLPRINMSKIVEGMVAEIEKIEPDRTLTKRSGIVIRASDQGLVYLRRA